MDDVLERWQFNERQVRERMYRAATPRERERWHAIWGWIREEVTANTCFGTKAKVHQHVG
jgi:hypothetical protein